mmetsp:Transcript_17635/g.49942  ORF Transcript_17635/g.49942 Transcript_17635/m.49942 type:complete len:225 (-) Transcript_17635:62-736(-)
MPRRTSTIRTQCAERTIGCCKPSEPNGCCKHRNSRGMGTLTVPPCKHSMSFRGPSAICLSIGFGKCACMCALMHARTVISPPRWISSISSKVIQWMRSCTCINYFAHHFFLLRFCDVTTPTNEYLYVYSLSAAGTRTSLISIMSSDQAIFRSSMRGTKSSSNSTSNPGGWTISICTSSTSTLRLVRRARKICASSRTIGPRPKPPAAADAKRTLPARASSSSPS